VIYSIEDHGGMISTGKTPDSFTRALWKLYKHVLLVAEQYKMAKEVMNLAYDLSLSYFKGFFNMP
jgi:hypothetical protein